MALVRLCAKHDLRKDRLAVHVFTDGRDTAPKSGAGWVEYEWAHPQTKKAEGKATYVKKLSNFGGYVAVGIYR